MLETVNAQNRIVLKEYLHGTSNKGRYFYYDGNINGLTAIDLSSSRGITINGWVFPFRDVSFSENKIVLFAKDSKIYVDFGLGPIEYIRSKVKLSKFFYFYAIEFLFEGKRKKFTYFMPPYREFLDDGMFSENMVPFYSVFSRLENDDEYCALTSKLTAGISI